jgi:hypothetical protein
MTDNCFRAITIVRRPIFHHIVTMPYLKIVSSIALSNLASIRSLIVLLDQGGDAVTIHKTATYTTHSNL